jgi:hypothetical protein
MFERFGWTRLGGSVFRYDGDDWLNKVVPALMFFRSYVLKHSIMVKFFTLDSSGVARIDHSDPGKLLGKQPRDGAAIFIKRNVKNRQSAESRLRKFVDAAINILN